MTWWDKVVKGPSRLVWDGTTQKDRLDDDGSPSTARPAPDGDLDVDLLGDHLDALVAQAQAAAVAERDDAALAEAAQEGLAASREAVLQAARGLGRSPAARSGDGAFAAKKQLDAVRKRAEGWRNGVSVTFGLILATLAVNPGEGFMQYDGGTEVTLRWLLGLSVALSLASLTLLIRSAHGPGWLKELSGPEATRQRFEARARGAYFDFWCGRWAWAVSLALFITAVAVTWFVELPA